MNVADLLQHRAERQPDEIALVEEPSGRTVSWSELDAAVNRCAQALQSRGLLAGQRVALAQANSIHFVVCYFAALRCGMVAVPLNPRATAGELGAFLGDVKARIVLSDDISASTLAAADTAGAEIVSAAELLATQVCDAAIMSPRDPESAAVIIYTSGTTHAARGVILSHRAILANIDQLLASDPPTFTPEDVVLGMLPFFGVYGLNAVLGAAVANGARLIIRDRCTAADALELAATHHVTNLPIAPPIVAAWAGSPQARAALADARLIISGAEPLGPDLAHEFEEATGHHLEQGYGLAEAGPVVTTTIAARGAAAVESGSVGVPLPGVELELKDQVGAPVQHGDPGQIWIRGANLFSGYWPDGRGGPDDDGWFATGDIGILGVGLTIVDRVRELVTVSGFSVYPREIEEVILASELAESVAAVAAGEPKRRLVAFVIAPEGADRAAVSSQILEYCADHLARFKVPDEVIVVDELPRTATGKIERSRLRAMIDRRSDL